MAEKVKISDKVNGVQKVVGALAQVDEKIFDKQEKVTESILPPPIWSVPGATAPPPPARYWKKFYYPVIQ